MTFLCFMVTVFFCAICRVSNIQEFDDDEGCDTDEWDSTDSSDHCATQEHQQQQTESENMIVRA